MMIVKCKQCEKEFRTYPSRIVRGRGRYCSKECQYQSMSNRIKKVCVMCEERFEVISSRKNQRYCSNRCRFSDENYKDSINMDGLKLGHGWNKGLPLSDGLKEKLRIAHLGKKHSEETKRKISQNNARAQEGMTWTSEMIERLSGKNASNWQGGKSFELYGVEFNGRLKSLIRKRDGYVCQECGYSQKDLSEELSVHHIDYDKENNDEENLISLCRACHSQTNYGRDDWSKYFTNKLATV